MSRRPSGLRARLVVTFALVAALASVAVAASSYLLVQEVTMRRATDSALREARLHLADVATGLPAGFGGADLRALVAGLRSPEAFELVAVHQGRFETTSISLTDSSAPQPLRDAVEAGRVAAARWRLGDRPVVVVGGAVQPDGPALYFFFPLAAVTADLALLRTVLTGASGAVVLVSAGVGWAAAGGLLVPIRRARRAVQRLEDGDLDTRLPEVGRDEFADLAMAFNRMAAALQRTVGDLRELEASHRRFVSDVSHELRTPLTALTTAAGVLEANSDGLNRPGGRAARLLAVEARRLAGLVENLMEISRLDEGTAPMLWEPLDLGASVGAALHARGWGDEVALRVRGDTAGLADPRRLDAIVGNLVGNAREHGRPPLLVDVNGDGPWVRVRVCDSGEGIPREHLDHVFDRFYKVDPARGGGSGLGLAIARQNARLHGGDISVASEPGRGAVFTVALPRRPPAAAVADLRHGGDRAVNLFPHARVSRGPSGRDDDDDEPLDDAGGGRAAAAGLRPGRGGARRRGGPNAPGGRVPG